MKMIEKLSEMIEEEIDDSCKYIKCALMHKEEFPSVSKLFYNLSEEELEHMSKLHTEVAKLIDEYKEKHGEAPEAMKAVYDYLHEKQIERVAEVKRMLAMYKEI